MTIFLHSELLILALKGFIRVNYMTMFLHSGLLILALQGFTRVNDMTMCFSTVDY